MAPVIAVPKPPETRAPSSVRSLTGWLIGFGASVLADQVFFLSLTWAALQVGTPAEVGLVLAAGSIPRLLILLIGGAFADRVSPKRIIVGTDSGRAVVMALAAGVLMLGAMSTPGLIVVALLIGALDGFFLPAVGALPARIAPPHLMGRVAALRTVTQRVAMLVGGPLAGWLIFLHGASAAFWASAALFAVSVVALALVTVVVNVGSASVAAAGSLAGDRGQAPPPPSGAEPAAAPVHGSDSDRPGPPGILSRVSEGLRTLRRDPVLPWLLLLIAGMNFGFAGPVTAGLPLLAADADWGAKGAGLLLGGFGLGAAVTGLGLVFVRWIPRAGWVAMASVTLMGLALAATGLSRSLACAVATTVLLGLASGVLGTVVHAMVLTTTPKEELGRVMALVSLSVEGVVPLSFAATGVLAGVAGPASVFFVGGGIILLTSALAFLRPRLRSVELSRPESPPAPPPLDAPFLPPLERGSIDPLHPAIGALRSLR